MDDTKVFLGVMRLDVYNPKHYGQFDIRNQLQVTALIDMLKLFNYDL